MESREVQVDRTVLGTQSRSTSLAGKEGLSQEVFGIVHKPTGPTHVKKILSRVQDRSLDHFRRPWHRIKRRECHEKILVLARKTYKVCADIGPTGRLMSRVQSVLDTGTGPNLIPKSELPSGMETFVSFRPTQDIGDANNRPLRSLGSPEMPLRLGRFVAAAEFIVCEKLDVSLIIGADRCDTFVEAIYPWKTKVKLADFSEVPIISQF